MLKTPIFWKIYLSSIILVLITVLTIGFLSTRQIESFELENTEKQLTVYANLLKDVYLSDAANGQPERLQAQVKNLSEKLSARLTVVAADGKVIGDSGEEPSKMDNHKNRPEIVASQTNAVGSATRYSDTVKQRLMYVAVAVRQNNQIVGYVRAAYPLTSVDQQLGEARNIVIFGGFIGAVLAIFVGFLFARQIAYPLGEMTELADAIAHGDYKQNISVRKFSDFGTLGEALNKMAKQIESDIEARNQAQATLEKAREELEKRVEERTLALSELSLSLKKQVLEHKRIEKNLQTSEVF
jgi:two-component system, OmpR family, phosphate regulon sensor histidine kinase PhoR